MFKDGERFRVGELDVEVIFSPGHTAASITYVVGDAAFIHDTLFMPDGGTARADFPGGDAHALYRSVRRILSLPPETRLFTGHDYQPGGRVLRQGRRMKSCSGCVGPALAKSQAFSMCWPIPGEAAIRMPMRNTATILI